MWYSTLVLAVDQLCYAQYLKVKKTYLYNKWKSLYVQPSLRLSENMSETGQAFHNDQEMNVLMEIFLHQSLKSSSTE